MEYSLLVFLFLRTEFLYVLYNYINKNKQEVAIWKHVRNSSPEKA